MLKENMFTVKMKSNLLCFQIRIKLKIKFEKGSSLTEKMKGGAVFSLFFFDHMFLMWGIYFLWFLTCFSESTGF